MTAASPIVADGADLKYNIILNHLYYKNSAKEDIDLAFQLGTEKKYGVATDAPGSYFGSASTSFM